MRDPLTIAPSHEELFVQRYERVLRWALQLTRNSEHAEDLVHDAYVQFVLYRPNLGSIGNLDSYLYAMLRNLFLSELRRATRNPDMTLSIADYDSAESGLRVNDLRDRLKVAEELRLVCHYACVRRCTSKAGSTLILRFFHGYYPSEIAKISRCTPGAVDEWLRIARREANVYLKNPGSLKFMHGNPSIDFPAPSTPQVVNEIVNGLRQAIFSTTRGNCLTPEQYRSYYQSGDKQAMRCETLAHLVGCSKCLDEVNRLLGLPSLAERHPTDRLGPDNRPRGDSGKGGPPSTGSFGEKQRLLRRKFRDVFEHRPKELRIVVNGFIMGSQRISSYQSEQTLSINLAEQVGFVEIFSEQGVRLAYLPIGAPPEGAVEQGGSLELSDSRTIDLALNFSSHWPTLSVVYQDPAYEARQEPYPDMVEPTVEANVLSPKEASVTQSGVGTRARNFINAFRLPKLNLLSWVRPHTVTAAFAILLIVALLFFRIGPAPVSATNLIQQAIAEENKIGAEKSLVIHRIHSVEARRQGEGSVTARRDVEVWQSAARGLEIRRVYGEQHRLLEVVWEEANGSRRTYRPRNGEHTFSKSRHEVPLSIEDATGLDLSANDFKTIVGEMEGSSVEEGAVSYRITKQSTFAHGEMVASLTIRKSDLHSIEQLLQVKTQSGVSEYRFIESHFESLPINAVPMGTFDPQTVSLKAAQAALPASKSAANITVLTPEAESRARASAELEVEVLNLLDQTVASLGGQVSVTRQPNGALKVHGVVENDESKREIKEALASMSHNPSVKIEVYTVAEALQQQAQAKRSPAQAPVETTERQEVDVTENRLPIQDELERYFAHQSGLNLVEGASNGTIESQVRNYSRRVTARSREALLHAWALRRLAERFSPEALRNLDTASRDKWRLMMRSHARSLGVETEKLRQELQPIFYRGISARPVQQSMVINSDAQLVEAAEQLFVLVFAHDRAIRHAFTITPGSNGAITVKAEGFWDSLRAAESLAASIHGSG